MNTTTNPSLHQLKEEYTKLNTLRKKYAETHSVDGLDDEERTYVNLCIQSLEAYREYKKVELSDFKFNRYHAPVIAHQIQRLKERLSTIKRFSKFRGETS